MQRGRQRHPRRPAGADRPPRMRAADGSDGLPIPSYEVFSGTEVLGRLSMEKMLAGIRSGGGAAPSSAGTGPRRRRSPKVLAFNAADSRSSGSPGVIRAAAEWSRNWAGDAVPVGVGNADAFVDQLPSVS